MVAHPDDEIIGCGGTLLKHREQGDNITLVYLTDGVSSRQTGQVDKIEHRNKMAMQIGNELNAEQVFFNFIDNQMDQEPLLNITKAIESITDKASADIVYTHHFADLNVDHRITHQAIMTVFRPVPNKKTPIIYTFEVNSSTEWNTPINGLCFTPTSFVDISKFIKQKNELLKIYQEEMHPYPHSRSIEAITNLNKVRGSSVGIYSAEAFMLIREIR